MDTDAQQALVDEVWDAIVEADDEMPMWDSPIEQIERWFTADADAEATTATHLRSLADRARDAAAAGGDLAPTLVTAADAARSLAGHLRTYVERELPHPELGLHSHCHWAVNNYPLQTSEHGDRWLDKLDRLPDAVGELTTRLTEAADAGRVQLARHSHRAVEKLDDHLGGNLDGDPFMAQAPPTEIDAEAADRWRAEVRDRVRDVVRPALAALRDTLHDHLAPAGPDAAAPPSWMWTNAAILPDSYSLPLSPFITMWSKPAFICTPSLCTCRPQTSSPFSLV